MKRNKNYLSIIPILLFGSFELNAQSDLTDKGENRYLERQPPEKIMAAIGIKPGMTIGEIGAGRGRMTVNFAREVEEWRKEIGLEPLKDYLARTNIKYKPAPAKK